MAEEEPNRGPGHVEVVVEKLGDGWVMISTAFPTEFQKLVEFERLPHLINETLVAWLGAHPGVRVRSSLGIVEDGYTIALHLWYDGHA